MYARLRHRCALIRCAALTCAVLFGGCAQPVREDRTIQWSKEGNAVGFQHGKEGVFLADKDGGKLTKIFQPDPSVIATSTPLWSPTGNRVLFTTARSPNGQAPVNLGALGGEQDPAGRLHLPQEILYTCWLHDRTDREETTKPVALFEATADHPGYVAANLAVRWHPRQERIHYVKQVAAHQHALFEFDLSTKQSRQVFPHTSEALIFDWTPDGSHLVCVLGSAHKSVTDGIWIGEVSQNNWWQVPNSGYLTPGEFGSLLENLRATAPAWTADGSRFAFPSYVPGPNPQQQGRYFVRHGTLTTRAVEVWAEEYLPFRDLRWDKASSSLGVVRGGQDAGSLHYLRRGQPLSPAINRAPVRRFAGWSADGQRLAYIAPDELPLATEAPWALLLLADPLARDKVYVAAGDGTEPGRPVFSGMRVTFPQWSPKEDKLSLWVTFMPAYRSVVSHLLGWGLRPGDPAAVFDLKTEQLGWMPVNAQEKVQVGHYYLLKRDYAEAFRWYEEAERELPQQAPAAGSDFMEFLRGLLGPRDFSLFQYHCLTKLGRMEEAKAKLEQFRGRFLPKFREAVKGQPSTAVGVNEQERQLQELLGANSLLGPLLEDLYATEVFLSLDAASDGEAFFRAELSRATTDSIRLSRAIVLGQILLLEKKHREYVILATESIAPLLAKSQKPAPAGGGIAFFDPTTLADFVGGLALMPMGATDFLSLLSDKQQLRDMLPRWEKLVAEANNDRQFLPNLVLHGLYQSLGREKERQQAAVRLQRRPAGAILPIGVGELNKEIMTMHTQMRDMLRRR